MAQDNFTEAELFGTPEDLSGAPVTQTEETFSEADLFGEVDFGSPLSAPEIQAAPSVSAKETFSEQELFGTGLAPTDNPLEIEKDYQALRILGDKPEDDYAPGFISSLQTGTLGLYDSAIRTPAKLFNDVVISLTDPDSSAGVWARSEQARMAQDDRELETFQAARPASKGLQEIAADDTTMGQAWDMFMESEDKWTLVKEVAGSSLPGTLSLIGGFQAKGLLGVFEISAIISFGDDYQESLRQGKSKDEALVSGAAKALTQGGFDMASFAFPMKVKIANKYADAVTQTLMQGVLGASAEAGKHVLVGEEVSGGRVVLNFAGEFLGAPLEIVTARRGKTAQDALAEVVADIEKIKKESKLKQEQTQVELTITQLEEKEKTAAEEEVALTEVLQVLEDGTVEQIPAQELQKVETGSGLLFEEELLVQEAVTVVTPDGVQKLKDVDWETTSVAVAEETHWKGQIEQNEVRIQEKEAELQTALQTNPETVSEIERALQELQGEQARLGDFRAEEIKTTQKAADLINEWVQRFAPEMKVVMSASQLGTTIADARFGTINRLVEQNQITPEEFTLLVNSMEKSRLKENPSTLGQHIKLPSGISVIEADVDSAYNSGGNLNQAIYLETVAHEFGHALLSHVYDNADLQTKKALQNGYRKWLKKLKNAKTSEEFENIRRGSVHAARFNLGTESVSIRPGDELYMFGMNEYIALQMEKAVGSTKLVGTAVEGFFKKALRLLREFFETNKVHLPEESFQDFLSLLAAKTTLSQLERAQAEANVQTQEQVLARAKETIGDILADSSLNGKGGGKGRAEKLGKNYGKEEFQGDLDKYNFVLKWGTTLLQMGKLNKHIVGLQKYIDLIKDWWNTKMQQTARADERLRQWNALKEKDAKNLGLFMQELTVKSYDDKKLYKPGDKVWERLVEKHKMSEDMLALADLIMGDFSAVLDELEAVQVDDAERTFTDENERDAAIKEIEDNFKALRERNFFPLSRFGDYYTRVKAAKDMIYEGIEYKVGDTITFETFERKKYMKKRQKVFKNRDKYLVEGGLMNDTQKQFAGFPPQFLTMLKNRLDLTEIQQGEFEDLIHDLAPGKSFTKHMMHRKNTPGYSTDGIRSYANYFLHFGNYVARIKYKGKLQDAINEVGDSAKIIGKRTGDGSKRTRIQQFMQNHYEAAMNPGNELANLRALGFLWYLGFVPKSAAVNLTQVPLVTYPFLAARYGDVQAIAALGKATKDAGKYWLNPRAMSEGQMRMIDELIRTGILDESMATELAAAAEGSLLNRVAPGNLFGSQKAARAVRRMAGAGAWMFQKAEKMNRRITALAAYGLARKAGKDHIAGVEAARDAVESTQYEYARWNRPRFSQGKKSVMFLFWQYMQNSLFFLAHDPGSMRYAAMMLLFAGLSGFPFAEDMMELYDYIAKKLNKRFGEDFAPNNIRLAAREFIDELGMNPDLIMHGASRYSFGLSAVGDAVGLPIPNVDMSGSLSMGSLIPGWGELLGDKPFDKGIGRAAEQLGGAVVAMPIQMMRAIADDNPDTLKRFERAMPSFAKHISKAYRYASRGEETLPDGTVISKFNLEDSMHKAEIAAQALGFNTTKVADAKEPFYMTKEIMQYYAMRRQSLTETLDYAKRSGDSEMWAKTWREVRKFNTSMRDKKMGILGIQVSSIKRSLKDRATQRAMQERGFVGGKRGVPLSREVYDAFGSEEEVP